MLELKFVKEGPGIPQVRVYLHGAVEPLSGLGYFTLAPEQPVGKSRGELTNSLTLEEEANLQELRHLKALQVFKFFALLGSK